MIEFDATVCDGQGDFARDHTIDDAVLEMDLGWIQRVEPGTLNLKISIPSTKGPSGEALGATGIKVLDLNPSFTPHIYLDHSEIVGNTLSHRRTPGSKIGDGQFWRAKITKVDSAFEAKAYMLRRVDSGFRDRVELIADCHLRTTNGLKNGDKVALQVFCQTDTIESS